ncbi:MAG: class I SAM-dependent methyltransferase [Candidatus Thermoplasmatota archaeon]
MDPIERTRRAYDEIAEEYCKRTEKEGDRTFHERMLDKTLDYLPDEARVIDLGCGDGRDTDYLRKKNLDVVGIDFSKKMISLAREKYPKSTFIHSDIRDTVFPDDTFHGAWASASLINLPKSELSHAEKEVYRIIEPEGVFCFSFKEGEREGFETSVLDENERYYSYYTLEEMKENLTLFDIFESERCPEKVFGYEFIYCWARARS